MRKRQQLKARDTIQPRGYSSLGLPFFQYLTEVAVRWAQLSAHASPGKRHLLRSHVCQKQDQLPSYSTGVQKQCSCQDQAFRGTETTSDQRGGEEVGKTEQVSQL